jgi:transposase
MIQLTPQMRILVATQPVDFRKGIDGLARICRAQLGADPFSGAVFVFTNRGRSSLRILVYDSQGFWLCHKRLSTGKFKWWPSRPGEKAVHLQNHELQVLLYGGDPSATKAAPPWRQILSNS